MSVLWTLNVLVSGMNLAASTRFPGITGSSAVGGALSPGTAGEVDPRARVGLKSRDERCGSADEHQGQGLYRRDFRAPDPQGRQPLAGADPRRGGEGRAR